MLNSVILVAPLSAGDLETLRFSRSLEIRDSDLVLGPNAQLMCFSLCLNRCYLSSHLATALPRFSIPRMMIEELHLSDTEVSVFSSSFAIPSLREVRRLTIRSSRYEESRNSPSCFAFASVAVEVLTFENVSVSAVSTASFRHITTLCLIGVRISPWALYFVHENVTRSVLVTQSWLRITSASHSLFRSHFPESMRVWNGGNDFYDLPIFAVTRLSGHANWIGHGQAVIFHGFAYTLCLCGRHPFHRETAV